jgi:N4-(beta-N-acetylglucosaminyl)-L-asparaginase
VAWKISLGHGGHNNWGPGLDAPPSDETRARVLGELRRAFPHASDAELAAAVETALHPPHGTINCIGLNEKGEMSAVTTTSGMAWKLPGRVGDSPIIGGGLWLDQDIGGAGSTGRGEENLRVCGAHTVVENMRHGMTPKEAALDALKRVQRNFNNDEKRLAQVDLQFYALRKDGEYASASLWAPPPGASTPEGNFAVCTADQASRQEKSVYLMERKAQ